MQYPKEIVQASIAACVTRLLMDKWINKKQWESPKCTHLPIKKNNLSFVLPLAEGCGAAGWLMPARPASAWKGLGSIRLGAPSSEGGSLQTETPPRPRNHHQESLL